MFSHALPPLSVSGNRIVSAADGEPVTLRGVNRSGLEYCSPEPPGSLAKAGITAAEFAVITGQWHANVVRLPFNQSWALVQEGYDPEPYLGALDFCIEQAAAGGAYTLLDLHWLDASTPRGTLPNGQPNFVPPLPDLNSIDVWRQLAARYRDEPAVLYDVFNEPHDALPNDPLGEQMVTMFDWQPWAKRLVNAIRSQNPAALIFVSGVNWGYDLAGFPLSGVDGLVYSTHVYPDKGNLWDGAFGDLALQHPVFAGEWGGEAGDVTWGSELASYFGRREMGWAAWSWSDRPLLIQPAPAPPYTATAFGTLVKSLLAGG